MVKTSAPLKDLIAALSDVRSTNPTGGGVALRGINACRWFLEEHPEATVGDFIKDEATVRVQWHHYGRKTHHLLMSLVDMASETAVTALSAKEVAALSAKESAALVYLKSLGVPNADAKKVVELLR